MYQPINQEQVQQTAQVLLSFLSDEKVSVPAPMLEGIVSGKSLLRAIIAGELLLCHDFQAPKEEGDSGGKSPAPKRKAAGKKVSKKAAA